MSDLSISTLLDDYEITDLLRSVRQRKILLDEDNTEDCELYTELEETMGKFAKKMSELVELDKERKGEKKKEESPGKSDSPYFTTKDGLFLKTESKPLVEHVQHVLDEHGVVLGCQELSSVLSSNIALNVEGVKLVNNALRDRKAGKLINFDQFLQYVYQNASCYRV